MIVMDPERRRRQGGRVDGELERITSDSAVMGGRACVRGLRITVTTVLNLIANGMTVEEITEAYPYLEEEDVRQCLRYEAEDTGTR